MNCARKIREAAMPIAAALVLGTLFFASCSSGSDTNYIVVNNSAQKKTFPVTVKSFKKIEKVEYYDDPSGDSLNLGFLEGKTDIPYVIVDESLLDETLANEAVFDGAKKWRSYKISPVTAFSTSVEIKNEKTNAKATFDLVHHACTFDNYDAFLQASEVYNNAAAPMMDYIRFAAYDSLLPYSNVPGQPVTLDWSTQDIGVILVAIDGAVKLAMPLQSFADIFDYPVSYNGSKLFFSPTLINGGGVSEYYSTSAISQGNRSEALAEYCYNELCMNLDFNYGLKAIHGIESFPDFDHYFAAAGIRDDLKSVEPLKFATQLKEVCEFYFGDGHSNYCLNSPYLGKDAQVPMIHLGSALEKSLMNKKKYSEKRAKKFGQATIPAYQVSSDKKTAIVRFDQFTFSGKTAAAQKKARDDLLANPALLKQYVGRLENSYETMAMFSAVNELIQNNKDLDGNTVDIENIVLDLSCNGGGANHAACFVLAWMLGYCKFDFRNPITGAKWSATYQVDVDFDGNFGGERDSVRGKNLFCLISPNSFSCGNMVPAVLKASDRVTILGTPSSGGTSCVQSSCAADGTIFRMSSKREMCTVKNGSYYDVDQGVEPHTAINTPASFYNVDTIANIVNGINN